MAKSEDKNSQNPSNGSSERKPNGQNVILYLVAIAAGAALLVVWVVKSGEPEISYPNLIALVEANAPGASADGSITVTVKQRGRPVRVRYSNLRDLSVGDRVIQGTVDVQYLNTGEGQVKEQRDIKFHTYKRDAEVLEKELFDKLKQSEMSWTNGPEPSAWRAYMPMLILTGILIAFFLIMMRRLGGAGSPMQFGRSRGKLYAMEDLGISFNDVAGINEAVEEVREIVDFLRSPDKYQRLGGRIPKGVLLVGPPGTGKTLLAKAIAGEASVPFFSLSGSDFVEMFVGVGAARVRDMFQQAETKAPCIIFIDELDALGKTRGSSIVGGHDEREQTLNALLVEMDGFDSNSGVIVMAATNRPETLDQALLRPGRFDRQVLVDRPDIRGREDILKVHVKQVKLDDSVDLKNIASITPGFVGADLANLVNEAALLAARRERAAVGMAEFNEGVERVTAGLEKKQRVMDEDEKSRVAYHESGHALVACSLPNADPVHKVSIIPRGLAALGYTMHRPEGDRFLNTQSELESKIEVLMGGTIAEEMVYADISTGAQNDLERATEVARMMVTEFGMSRLGRVNYRGSTRATFLNSGAMEGGGRTYSEKTAREIDEEVRRIIDAAIESVRHILEVRHAALEAIAQRLIEIESIDADELRRLIESSADGPIVVPGTTDRAPRPPFGEQRHGPTKESTSDSDSGPISGQTTT